MSWKIHDIFNEVLLKPYHPPTYSQQKKYEQQREKEKQYQEESEGEYEVEEILNSWTRKRGRKTITEYLVKWKSELPGEDLTWEPEHHLKNAQELVQEFKARRIKAHHKQLYGWDDKQFKPKYLEHLEHAWQKWKQRPLLDKDDPDAYLFVRTQTKWEGDVKNQKSFSSKPTEQGISQVWPLIPVTILSQDHGSRKLSGGIAQQEEHEDWQPSY